MREVSIEYLTGLFDGEGAVYMSGREYRNAVVVSFTNTNKELAELFRVRWGGKVHGFQPKKGRLIYKWNRCQFQAKPFIEAILPFSIEKKELLELALKYIECIPFRLRIPHDSPAGLRRQAIALEIFTAQKRHKG